MLEIVEDIDQDQTVSFEDWLDFVNTNYPRTSPQYGPDIRTDAMEFLNESKSISGYMTEPVSKVDNKVITAVCRNADSLEELKEFFDKSTNRIFPYMILHEPKYDDTGVLIRDQWRVRYAEVESV